MDRTLCFEDFKEKCNEHFAQALKHSRICKIPTPPYAPQPHAHPSLRATGYCARVSITTLTMKAKVWQKRPCQVCQTDLKAGHVCMLSCDTGSPECLCAGCCTSRGPVVGASSCLASDPPWIPFLAPGLLRLEKGRRKQGCWLTQHSLPPAHGIFRTRVRECEINICV